MPKVCPFHEQGHPSCKLSFDHMRERKTGPCFPVYVMRCASHKLGFTIYPPGHVPYGRQRIAPVAPDGSLAQEEVKPEQQFEGTLFDAALDAARGQLWDSESDHGSHTSRFSTQLNHLHRCAILFGLLPCLDPAIREEISQLLSIPGQLLHDKTRSIAEDRSCKNLGRHICGTLKILAKGRLLFELLAEAGTVTGLWHAVQLWCGKLQNWRFSLFHNLRTRASPGWRDTIGNPTT